jgi:acyl-CoA thioester hydrolase
MGHINNCSISGWFETARISYLESLGSGVAGPAVPWVLASLHLDFLLETFYGSDVTAAITGVEVGNSSLTIDCEMTQRDRCTVRGRAVLVHFDEQTKQSSPIPDDFRQKIQQGV